MCLQQESGDRAQVPTGVRGGGEVGPVKVQADSFRWPSPYSATRTATAPDTVEEGRAAGTQPDLRWKR